MRTRMSGGVGAEGSIPSATRLLAERYLHSPDSVM
jgi:hypothetical protein